ncbi:MAG: response regulator [Kofleriaceae bacterium]
METTAIIISLDAGADPLGGLIDRLASLGVEATLVDELATAAEIARRQAEPPALLLDLRELAAGEVEDLRKATALIRRLQAAIPNSLPIAVTSEADNRLIVACIRAGAADVIDLAHEGTATARAVVQRVCQRQRERAHELDLISQQRTIIEDLLKDLIRTERRSIDAEEKLAFARLPHGRGDSQPNAESRSPAILLIEHDRGIADDLADLLEAAGVATFAYVTGEEALREAETLATTTGLDLALVAAQLPGIDGLESVRRLRDRVPGLPAFLMTSVHDADLAEHAADLGVVGFVHKPLEDVDDIVQRLAQLARESLQRTREHVYLERIKERHERVLARYRALPREP